MIWTLAALALGIALLGTPAWGAEVDGRTRELVSVWAAERDLATRQYVRSWLRGEPEQARAVAGLTIVAREAGIATALRERAPDSLQREALLWGRRVTPETLPVVLLEALGIHFEPTSLFAGRTLLAVPYQPPDPLGSETFHLVVRVVQMAPGITSPLRSEEGYHSRDRGTLITAGLADGSVRFVTISGLSFKIRWLHDGSRLAGKPIRINGQLFIVQEGFADGWQLDIPIVDGRGWVELPKTAIGPNSQVIAFAPPQLSLAYPSAGALRTMSSHDWQRRTGLAMSELQHISERGCGGSGCKSILTFVAR